MNKIEKQLEIRTRIKAVEDASGEVGGVEGYGTTFDQIPDLDGDRVLAGAAGSSPFRIPMLAFHDRKMPIGSAVMTPDPYGVKALGTYANTPASQDMRELVKAQAVPAFSIGFWSDDYEKNEFGGVDFKSIHIYEVSLVPIPANPRALVTAAKSLGGAVNIEDLQGQRKQYVDVEPPSGSYEAIREDLREALVPFYADNSYITIMATFKDRAVYCVESYPAIPAIDGTWQISYSYDDANEIAITWPPETVEVTQTVSTASDDAGEADATGTIADEKSGKRNRSDDQKALNAAHDMLVKAGADCETAIGSGSSDESDDDKKELDEAKDLHPTSRADLRLLTEVLEFEASV